MLYPGAPSRRQPGEGGQPPEHPATAAGSPWTRAGLAAIYVLAGHEPLENLEELLEETESGALPRLASNC